MIQPPEPNLPVPGGVWPLSPDAAGFLGAGWFLDGQLGEDALRQLSLAAVTYGDRPLAEAHLKVASILSPGHSAVLACWHRYYALTGRPEEAREVARLCLDRAIAAGGLDCDWEQVRPEVFAAGNRLSPPRQLLLEALMAYASHSLALRDVPEARRALQKLIELDPLDRLGARIALASRGAAEGPDEP